MSRKRHPGHLDSQ